MKQNHTCTNELILRNDLYNCALHLTISVLQMESEECESKHAKQPRRRKITV